MGRALPGGSSLFRFRFFLSRQAPAPMLAMQTLILLFPGDGRRVLHTEDLVHRLAGSGVVTREPAFAVKWAGIFMFAPI